MSDPPEKTNETHEVILQPSTDEDVWQPPEMPKETGVGMAQLDGMAQPGMAMAAPSHGGADNLSDDQKKRLNEINDKLLDEMSHSITLLDRLKKNIENVSNDISVSFGDTRIMYWSIFLLGVVLVIIAVPIALYTNKELFSLLFGSAGVIDILAFFLKDPPQQLQKSRTNLSKLQAAYYLWLLDTYNWSAVLYSQSGTGDLDVKAMKEASDSYVESFTEIMRAVDGGAQDTGTAAKGDK